MWMISKTHQSRGAVSQSSLKKLRGKNFQGSDDEWAQIVSYALGQLPPSAGAQEWLAGVETSASISGSHEEDKEMVITIRKRIQSITVRLSLHRRCKLFSNSSTAKARLYNTQTGRRTIPRAC